MVNIQTVLVNIFIKIQKLQNMNVLQVVMIIK